MAATGLGFATVVWFWPLLVVAVVGTLNPSAGDVSVFLPTEQAFVAGEVTAPDRPRLFAMYNLAAIFTAALGALASGLPEVLAHREGWDVTTAQRSGFVLYALLAVVILALYRGLVGGAAPPPVADRPPPRVRHSSRRIVLELAALFSLDSAGRGLRHRARSGAVGGRACPGESAPAVTCSGRVRPARTARLELLPR
jgi:hypothetical protein